MLRRGEDLQTALVGLNELTSELSFASLGAAEYELLNMLTVGTQIAKCALLREESRGVHLRDDFPARDDQNWRRHVTLRLPAAGEQKKVSSARWSARERARLPGGGSAGGAPGAGRRSGGLRRHHRCGFPRRRRRPRGRARGEACSRGSPPSSHGGAWSTRPCRPHRGGRWQLVRRRCRGGGTTRSAGRDPRRRAHRPQLPLPSFRYCDAHGLLCGASLRHGGAHRCDAQDNAGSAGAREAGGGSTAAARRIALVCSTAR